MKSLVEININRKVNCSRAVAIWNFWDHEHLDVVHNSYENTEILYEKDNVFYNIRDVTIPFLGIKAGITPIFQVQKDDNTLFVLAIFFGVFSKTTTKIIEITKDSCQINTNFKFYLNGWQIILKPLLKFLIPKWNKKLWDEDLPLKLRRQKVLRYNFKDFVGLPDKIEDRNYEGDIKVHLPIPRPKNSTRQLSDRGIKE